MLLNNRTPIYLLLLVALSAMLPVAHAQHIAYKRFEATEVMTGVFNYRTYEDSKGNIWFLTNKGISRFDGVNSLVFGPEHGYFEGGAYQIQEDKNKDLWITTVNFKLYCYKNGKFHKVKSQEQICWLDIHPVTGNMQVLARQYNDTTGIYNVLPDYTLANVCFYKYLYPFQFIQLNENERIVSSFDGVWLFTGKHQKLLLPAKSFINHVTSRIIRLNNRVFITTHTGIYEYRNKSTTLIYGFKNTEIYDIQSCVLTNNIWVTNSKGIWFFSNDLKKLTGSLAIEDAGVFSTSFTRKSGVLISTTHGVFTCNPTSLHFSIDNELELSNVLFVKNESDNLYFFHQNLFFYQYSNKKLVKRKYPEKAGSKKLVSFVKNLADTQVMLACKEIYHLKKGVLIDDPSEAGGDSGPVLINSQDLLYASKSSYYIDGYNKTLLSAKQNDELVALLAKSGIRKEYNYPWAWQKDTLFFSTSKGLIKAIWADGKLSYKLIPLSGLINQVIVNDTLLIVCTQTDGVYLFSKKGDKHINSTTTLLTNLCSAIYLRGEYLWIATTKGLSRVNLINNNSFNFTARDYLLSNKVNDVDFFKGDVYVGTDKGVSFFKENAEQKKKSPHIYLEHVSVNNNTVALDTNYESDYTHNNYTLSFSSPGLRSGPYNRYRLIIESASHTDTTFYNEENIQLFALAPDRYKLSVDVKNIDGVWSTKPVIINVLIHPPFWKTIWFISLVILIICSIVGYMIWVSVKRQKEMQEYRRKITESELKSLRLYMNPHFLFNSLTSLQSFILTVKTGEANHFITKFSKLIRAVMSYSVRGELLLKEEIQLLKDYLELESVRFGTGFSYHIGCEEGIDIENTSIPSLIIQPFVENAIKHGVTGVSEQCYIKVWFEMRGKELYCIVADNGKGRSKEPKKETDHISSGIKFTEERIKLLINHKNKPVITISDTDPANTLMPGTTVEIHVPVLNDQNDDV